MRTTLHLVSDPGCARAGADHGRRAAPRVSELGAGQGARRRRPGTDHRGRPRAADRRTADPGGPRRGAERALPGHRRRRRWPSWPATTCRSSRSRRAACGARRAGRRTRPSRRGPAQTPTAYALEDVVRRYLAAFGPASTADIRTWSWLTGVREIVDRIRPDLRTYRDERGRELLDVEDGLIADPDLPAPVRFLPQYDNVFLSHDDRSRINGTMTWGLDFAWKGPILIDGGINGDVAGPAREGPAADDDHRAGSRADAARARGPRGRGGPPARGSWIRRSRRSSSSSRRAEGRIAACTTERMRSDAPVPGPHAPHPRGRDSQGGPDRHGDAQHLRGPAALRSRRPGSRS